MMDLHIELLQHFTKKLVRGKAKAAGEVILEDNSIVLTGHWDGLTLWKFSPAYGNTAILLKFKNHFLRHERRPKILGLASHNFCFFSPVRKMDPRPIYFRFWCLMTNIAKLD